MAKKMKRNNTLSSLLLGTCLLTLVACGSDDDDNGGGFAAQPEEQTEEGIYRVDFDALNTKIPDGTEIHNLEGNLIIRIEGDQVNVVMGARNAPSGTHRAHVHTGRNCPTMANDANGDGFVDFVEAAGVTGPSLIPLDGNLDSQEEGSGNNPSGSTIAYSESTTLSEMMADLQAPDPNPEDGLAKLPAGEALNLEGRVVEIHGVGGGVILPPTVATEAGVSTNESLPIACGVLRKVADEDDVISIDANLR